MESQFGGMIFVIVSQGRHRAESRLLIGGLRSPCVNPAEARKWPDLVCELWRLDQGFGISPLTCQIRLCELRSTRSGEGLRHNLLGRHMNSVIGTRLPNSNYRRACRVYSQVP